MLRSLTSSLAAGNRSRFARTSSAVPSVLPSSITMISASIDSGERAAVRFSSVPTILPTSQYAGTTIDSERSLNVDGIHSHLWILVLELERARIAPRPRLLDRKAAVGVPDIVDFIRRQRRDEQVADVERLQIREPRVANALHPLVARTERIIARPGALHDRHQFAGALRQQRRYGIESPTAVGAVVVVDRKSVV